jgi:hypothetical protein
MEKKITIMFSSTRNGNVIVYPFIRGIYSRKDGKKQCLVCPRKHNLQQVIDDQQVCNVVIGCLVHSNIFFPIHNLTNDCCLPHFGLFFMFLAHLAKGNVNFCHHLASVVR